MTLLVCYTALHVLIAERLLAKGHIKQCVLVYICFDDSRINRRYYERLAARAVYARYEVLSRNPWLDAARLVRVWIRIRGFRYSEFATGNLKHVHSRLLLRLVGDVRLTTFDDGSGSISKSGYFYVEDEHPYSKALFSVIGPSCHYRNIVSTIDRHFTIYDASGVYADKAREVTRIELLDSTETTPATTGETTISLGNVFALDGLCDAGYEARLEEYVARRYAPDLILPHPRSDAGTLARLNTDGRLGTGAVAEEEAMALLAQGRRVRVVGSYSSALLNLAHIRGVSAVNVCCRVRKPVGELEGLMAAAGVAMDREFEQTRPG